MSGNAIPAKIREVVGERDQGRCVRCGSGTGREIHHRRRRRVKGHYQHCACNCVTLCVTCHREVHRSPVGARESGFIVSAYHEEPFSVQLETWTGRISLDCEGGITLDEHVLARDNVNTRKIGDQHE